jgi:DNA-binding beta-propeller fold protein YncE
MLRNSLLAFAAVLGGCSGAIGPSGGESAEGLSKVPASTGSAYTLFESLQVRPLALSPSGKLLFAANTPDNRLEIFAVTSNGPVAIGSVSVGSEPVAIAARTDNEVWVVNHLSDSVSIVNVNGGLAAYVARTLHVGDEPRDIVFAGANKNLAFITTAHRGQNTGDAYDMQTAGVGRADVWVFDAKNLGTTMGGTRLTKITLFADTPRALAASADGTRVYAAGFNTGNQTTSVSSYAVATMNGGHMPGPATINLFGQVIPQPPTGLVVKYKGGHWLDMYNTPYDPFVKVNLPDLDVFQIDATANPPVATASRYAHVGTTLFNMAVNPANGHVYVTNTDARNDIRFEGHTPGFTSVRGHITDQRITVIDPSSGAVAPRLLNTHINYDADFTAGEKELSVAFPQDIALSKDGSTAYVVAQGSGKLAIYNTSDLEAGNPTPSLANQVVLSGGGPTGVALDEGRGKAYVLTRFDNSIKVVDLASRAETKSVAMFNPEPASVTNGRKYLYDATITSSHGDTACASCHIGGDKDELAWDLGNPGGFPLSITHASGGDPTESNIFTIPPAAISQLLPAFAPIFGYNMPVKGPMTTQSLRGMDNHGAMHWRGDRNGAVNQDTTPVIDPATGQPVVSAQPNAGIFDEVRAFTSFNVAFPGLVGNPTMLAPGDMLDFATFILQATYPPNPVRNLDDSLTAQQQIGHDFFFNSVTLPDGTKRELPSDRFHNCNGCHVTDRNGNAGATAHPGFFGTDGRLSFEFETQIFKVPHLRNLYTKIGMFGSSLDTLQPGTILLQQGPPTDQVRGFGFQHDGDLGTMEHFFTGQVFLRAPTNVILADGTNVGPNPFGIPLVDPNTLGIPGQAPTFIGQADGSDVGGFQARANLVSFLMVFDSNMKPIVGQQVTLNGANAATAGARVSLLESQAAAGNCDLVAKAISTLGVEGGYLYQNGAFQPASTRLPPVSDANLRKIANVIPVTFTCLPPGEGVRVALDRDGDGWADLDEVATGHSPTNAADHP